MTGKRRKTVESPGCEKCGSTKVKRVKVTVGYVLIVFGALILLYLFQSNLPASSSRGLGNIAVGIAAIAYGGLILWRRKYKCLECGHAFRLR